MNEKKARKKSREGEMADLIFPSCRVPLPAKKKLQFQHLMQLRIEQPQDQENWNGNYRSYKNSALPPRVFEDP